MSVDGGEWTGPVRAGIVTVLSVLVISSGSLIVATFQGHASDKELDRVEREAKERDTGIRRALEEHLKQARAEALAQAGFRGAVREALKIKKE